MSDCRCPLGCLTGNVYATSSSGLCGHCERHVATPPSPTAEGNALLREAGVRLPDLVEIATAADSPDHWWFQSDRLSEFHPAYRRFISTFSPELVLTMLAALRKPEGS